MSPLFKGKKNISKNIETEERAGKKPKQALAIALSFQKRKKMAKGGKAEITADGEKRPMPDQTFADSKDAAQQDAPKHKPSGWTDNKREAGKSGPMKANSVDESFTTEDMTDSEKARTAAEMNMKGMSSDPKKVNANHSKDMPKMMAQGGSVNFSNESRASEDSSPTNMMKENYSSDPMGINSDHNKYAQGGEVEDHYDSIADAILAKKRRKMAEGGRVDIESNNQEQPNSYYPANEEALDWDDDQDFASAQPEDSNEQGDDLPQDDKQESLVDAIRRKSKKNKYQP